MTHTPHRKKKRPFRGGRRLLAATLFGALLALLLVQPAAAETKPWSGRIADAYAGGAGTPDDPYRIATGDQLARLAQRVNEGEDAKDADAHYLLVADIDLIGGPLRNWTPIGAHETRPFGGVLDGGGHAIVGLWVVGGDEEKDYAYASAGLFGRVHGDEAAIRNLVLTDVRVDVRASGRETSIAAGALAGSFYGAGGIENVSAQGAIVVRAADAAYAGGIVGTFDGPGQVRDVRTRGTALAEAAYACAGGLAGIFEANGVIERAFADSDVHATGEEEAFVGGLVGSCATESGIRDARAIGNVSLISYASASVYAGGLVGRFSGDGIARAYAAGDVVVSAPDPARTFAGGLAGELDSGNVPISACYAWGNVLADRDAKPGGLVGNLRNGEVSACFWRRDPVSGDVNANLSAVGKTAAPQPPAIAAAALTTEAFATATHFRDAGWDFEHDWQIASGDIRPLLRTER